MGTPRIYRHRPLEERVELYSKVHELRSKGLGIRDIAQSLGISRRDVSYWFRVNRPSRTVYSPDLTPRPDLSYLVGAYLGDGRTAGPKDKRVRFNLADSAFANLLNELVAQVLGATLKTVTVDGGFYSVSYDSAVLYDFLQQPIHEFSKLIESFPSDFLRGFFDAEGFASPKLNHKKQLFSGIEIGAANTNLDYLALVSDFLTGLGIESRLAKTHKIGEAMTSRGKTFTRRHEVSQIRIDGIQNAFRYHSVVGFSVPSKKDKLDDMIAIINEVPLKGRYVAFLSSYTLRNRRWAKITGRHNWQ